MGGCFTGSGSKCVMIRSYLKRNCFVCTEELIFIKQHLVKCDHSFDQQRFLFSDLNGIAILRRLEREIA